jgi:periplasmic protein TonB
VNTGNFRHGRETSRTVAAFAASLGVHLLFAVVITATGGFDGPRSSPSDVKDRQLSSRTITVGIVSPPAPPSDTVTEDQPDDTAPPADPSPPTEVSPSRPDPSPSPDRSPAPPEPDQGETLAVPAGLLPTLPPGRGDRSDRSDRVERTEAAPEVPITPEYPLSARRRGIEGEVLLEAVISATGDVLAVSVVESSDNPRLDEAALRAVQETPFTPAKSGSTPRESTTRVRIAFSLQ